ncbi:hypothetical protein [Arenimonas sp. GDDSR-1]|uniref:hypothetical protein n=1 Tax=Arenimonas sp. GDDSR-1 TaxID=2950125 RepID=UPI002622DA58|nr:hypothetical protein [Arenimonas sp. GDDSR-1]
MRCSAWLLAALAVPAFAGEPDAGIGNPDMPASIVLTPAQLAEYSGVYPLLATVFLKVFVEQDQLMAQVLGQPAFPLTSDGDDIFSAPAYQIEIKFERDNASRVIGLGLLQSGMELKAQKMPESPRGG